MAPDVGTKKPRPKYKRLYQMERRERMEVERRLTALRGHVDRLGPVGEAIARRLDPNAAQYVLAPHEWLAFAVWMETIARDNAPTWGVQLLSVDPHPILEQAGFGQLFFDNKPVVPEGVNGG